MNIPGPSPDRELRQQTAELLFSSLRQSTPLNLQMLHLFQVNEQGPHGHQHRDLLLGERFQRGLKVAYITVHALMEECLHILILVPDPCSQPRSQEEEVQDAMMLGQAGNCVSYNNTCLLHWGVPQEPPNHTKLCPWSFQKALGPVLPHKKSSKLCLPPEWVEFLPCTHTAPLLMHQNFWFWGLATLAVWQGDKWLGWLLLCLQLFPILHHLAGSLWLSLSFSCLTDRSLNYAPKRGVSP